jgi:hypothetical protein
MGGSQSKSTITNETVKNVITKNINNITVKKLQRHKANGSSIQKIIGTTKDGNVIISGAKMENIVTITLDSYKKLVTKSTLLNTADTTIDTIFKNQAKASAGLTPSLKSQETELINKYKTEVKSLIENNITDEQISECLATGYQYQEIRAETDKGNVTIENIDMYASSTISAKCIATTLSDLVFNNDKLTSIVEDIKNVAESEKKDLDIKASVSADVGIDPDLKKLAGVLPDGKLSPLLLLPVGGASVLLCCICIAFIIFIILIFRIL